MKSDPNELLIFVLTLRAENIFVFWLKTQNFWAKIIKIYTIYSYIFDIDVTDLSLKRVQNKIKS